MSKKILGIILAALGLLAIGVVAWWWFFARPHTTPTQTATTFGTAGDKGGSANSSGAADTNGSQTYGTNSSGQYTTATGGDTATNVPQQITQTNTGANGNQYGAAQDGSLSVVGAPVPTSQPLTLSGVDWVNIPSIDSGNTSGGGIKNPGAGTVFNPKGINTVLTPSDIGYNGLVPNIGGGGSSSGGGGLGLAGTAGVAAVAGGLSCGAAEAFSWAGEALGVGETEAAVAGPVAALEGVGVASAAARTPTSVQTVDLGNYMVTAGLPTAIAASIGIAHGSQKANNTVNTFFSCLARTVAKVALNQITASVVNWINSGFNGSPSFVTNPTQFFTNVADQAAGSFIKSSALSFLCSPFKLQIRIAIAQSYANRNNAASCTLTGVTNNITGFMNNFSSGGWPALLSFTTTPTNNPYGAFIYAEAGLNSSVLNAQNQKNTDLNRGGGFLSFQQKVNCTDTTNAPAGSPNRSVDQVTSPDGNVSYRVCDLKATTPGTIIQNSLIGTNNSTLNELNLAKNFDEIINALISQLMTRTLQQGLSNLSGQNGYASNFYTPDQLQAQDAAQKILVTMQGYSGIAQEYGAVEQGSIGDIQNTQNQLSSVYNCWSAFTSASTTNSTAITNANAASTTIASLDLSVDSYNREITRANAAIILLQDLENRASSAASTADVKDVTDAFGAAQSNGKLLTPTDITTAQQDRATLQASLSSINSRASQQLDQCNAFSN